ncbi:MAG: 4Fe-4S dicluster domain-containing protein [bacterium]
MEYYKLNKSNIDDFIAELRKGYAVYAPVDRDGITSFAHLAEGESPNMDFLITQKPPKEVFYPQTEVLLRFDGDKTTPSKYDGGPIAIFGVRPCDARGFRIVEKVFVDDRYKDFYWLARRKDSLVIAVGCNSPLRECFCNWVGGGPFGTEGSDVLAIDTGEEYILDPITEAGKKALSSMDCLEKAADTEVKAADAPKANAVKSMSQPPDMDDLKQSLDSLFDDPFWNEVTAKCLGCAVCTFSCPTCYCFDIQDESRRGKGVRLRIWDTCQFPIFTKEGSGHNPRKSQMSRLRQRYMHKFSYMIETISEFGCVGCGRCVTACPVNIDVREFIVKSLETAQQKGAAV